MIRLKKILKIRNLIISVIILFILFYISNRVFVNNQIKEKEIKDSLFFIEYAKKQELWKDSLRKVLGDTIFTGNPLKGVFVKIFNDQNDSSETRISYLNGKLQTKSIDYKKTKIFIKYIFENNQISIQTIKNGIIQSQIFIDSKGKIIKEEMYCDAINIKKNNFEIAKIDFYGSWLQRIFVVISSSKVNDTIMIKQIIWSLKTIYPLNNKSRISFFSERKYANYKTELFFGKQNLLPQSEYKNWMDFYYLGEYDFETNQYLTYPESNKIINKKIFIIKGSP